MKLYKNSNGVWAGTQSDARKMCGKDYTVVDVPVDKSNLLKFLNLNQVGSLTDNDKQSVDGKSYDLTPESLSWIRWSYDKICSGQYEDCREMLRKGLGLAAKEINK